MSKIIKLDLTGLVQELSLAVDWNYIAVTNLLDKYTITEEPIAHIWNYPESLKHEPKEECNHRCCELPCRCDCRNCEPTKEKCKHLTAMGNYPDQVFCRDCGKELTPTKPKVPEKIENYETEDTFLVYKINELISYLEQIK